MATAAIAPAPAAARVESATQRRLRRRPPSPGRSRMAAMMLTREMRMLVSATVRNAIRKPSAKPFTRLVGVTLKPRSSPPSAGEKLAKIRAATSTTARPTASPAATPSAAAASAYTAPSITNPRTSRPRRMPTARSIPSSALRSSASITKTFTSSRTPAMTAKLPTNRNSEPRPSPACLASSSTSCLGLSTEVPWRARGPSAAVSLPATRSLLALPPSTPPVLETRVRVSGWTLVPAPTARWTVPGCRKALASP
jgi:hypothetical protein